MFVYSVKSNQIKLAALVLFVILSAVILFFLAKDGKTSNASVSEVSLKASTAEERTAFLSQFGWEIDEDPCEVTEVIIPAEFDETYASYNEIQKTQGFDLTKYASKRVKRWTYTVKNYPGYENASCIRANILVSDGMVIGGDICSVELNGFMQSFYYPTVTDTTVAPATTVCSQ